MTSAAPATVSMLAASHQPAPLSFSLQHVVESSVNHDLLVNIPLQLLDESDHVKADHDLVDADKIVLFKPKVGDSKSPTDVDAGEVVLQVTDDVDATKKLA